jgi:hypothetical protein
VVGSNPTVQGRVLFLISPDTFACARKRSTTSIPMPSPESRLWP